MNTLPRIIVLVGPTASGKTAMSIALARAFGGEILCADSRTVYKEMDIGTAKPPGEVQRMLNDDGRSLFSEKPLMYEDIPHWGCNLLTPNELWSVSEYQTYADAKIAEILARGNMPILVGGTGLYIAAVIDRPSFAHVPPDPALRMVLAQKTNQELVEELAEKDPDAAERIDVHNRRRVERALEIVRATGRRLADVQQKGEQKYDVCMLGVLVNKEELTARIDARVDAMIAQGLVDEVRRLRQKYGDDAPGMTGIGYRQICAFLRGGCSLRDAILALKQDTRQYAKRQMTWFQRDPRIHWVGHAEDAYAHINTWIHTV